MKARPPRATAELCVRLRCLPLFSLVLTLGGGCVVKYGARGSGSGEPGPAAEPPVELADEARALKRLLESTELIDQQDRINAALALADLVTAEPGRAPRHVEAYLQQLHDIELRGQPSSVPLPEAAAGAASFGAAGVREVELDAGGGPVEPAPKGPDVALFDPDAPTPAPVAGPDVPTLLAAAAQRSASGDLLGAMLALEACRDLPCWAEVKPAYIKARDAEVFRQKELAAQRFLELRGEASVARHRDGLLAIAAELSALRAKYPDSAHAAEIGKHIERVQRELEALPEP